MFVRGRVALAMCWLCLPACVDGASDDTPAAGVNTAGSGGGPSSGGSAGNGVPAGGSAAAGLAGSTAGTASGGSAGAAGSGVATGGAMPCANYADNAAWKLKVQIKNQRSTTIYVGQPQASCAAARLFQVEDGSRSKLPSIDACRNSCSAAMSGNTIACTAACAAPTTVTLEPGQSIDVPWDGLFAVPQTLPQQCLQGSQGGPSSCVQAARITAGPFTFTAQAGTRLECLNGSACTCSPNTSGGCSTSSSLIGGTIITTEFFVLLEPGELSPSGEPQYIGLVFKD